jgi:hypothetical protein
MLLLTPLRTLSNVNPTIGGWLRMVAAIIEGLVIACISGANWA